MMSTRRDLYLLMLTYSNLKDHLDTDDLVRFLEAEQKVHILSTFISTKLDFGKLLQGFSLTLRQKHMGRVKKTQNQYSSFLCLYYPQCNANREKDMSLCSIYPLTYIDLVISLFAFAVFNSNYLTLTRLHTAPSKITDSITICWL